VRIVLASVLAVVAIGCSDGGDRSAGAAPVTAAAVTDINCDPGGSEGAGVGRRDVVIGPLALVGALDNAARRRNAFGGHGYKIPATLPVGQIATLKVPPRWHGKVGLIFTQADQARAWEQGVRNAPRAVRFTACAGSEAGTRSGWPGGIVVDRPRCPTLVVRVIGSSERHRARVPLGRRCT
jgi:hypothetical protein